MNNGGGYTPTEKADTSNPPIRPPNADDIKEIIKMRSDLSDDLEKDLDIAIKKGWVQNAKFLRNLIELNKIQSKIDVIITTGLYK